MNNTILILGGDGYLGWPLAMKIAVKHFNQKIIIVDNEWRRNTVRKFNFHPLFTVAGSEERLSAFGHIYGLNNIHYQLININSGQLEKIIEKERPHTIYHLAQQCSAPYSMLGVNESIYTLRNNEEGNLRLLWAVKDYVPDAHIIKLGSFGEYAKGGINIAEGYFQPIYQGAKAKLKMPYPRESNDIYHISKINDSNFAAMAARVWGLRITDVMQSTVFGFDTAEMAGCEQFRTRFDYDHIFGTVVNRFLIQAVSGHPMTVYGKGNQRTGLMALKDAVNSLAGFVDNIAAAGEHRVINHVTETGFSINELAQKIAIILRERGYDAQIIHTDDPRNETAEYKLTFDIETSYTGHRSLHSPFHLVINGMVALMEKYNWQVYKQQFIPQIYWNKGQGQKDRNTDCGLYQGQNNIDNEVFWESIRREHFPCDRVNLNPGTFGTTLAAVQYARNREHIRERPNGYPLSHYLAGRNSYARIKVLCNQIWPSQEYLPHVVHNTSQSVNLIALALIRKLYTLTSLPFKVVTTLHEHKGGIGPFESLPEFKVFYLSDQTLNDPEAIAKELNRIQPHIAFFSHITYDTGVLLPVEKWMNEVSQNAPDCKIILDIAQSLGLHSILFGQADIIIGSTHKWLFGPHGGGLAWIKKEFASWIGGLFWNENVSAVISESQGFDLPGGQDFRIFEAIEACLIHYQKIGKDTILKRSCFLRAYLQNKLGALFNDLNINHSFLNDNLSPIITIALKDLDPYQLYDYLNEQGFHLKCIRNREIEGYNVHILRLGIPYYETLERLEQLLLTVTKHFLKGLNKEVSKPSFQLVTHLLI